MTGRRQGMDWRGRTAKGIGLVAVAVFVAGLGLWRAQEGVAQTPSLLPKLEEIALKLDRHLERFTRRLAGIEETLGDLQRDQRKSRDEFHAKFKAQRQTLEQKFEAQRQTLEQKFDALKTLEGKVDSLRSWHENGSLQITGTPAGATVKVDGEVKGILPDAGQPPLQVTVTRYYPHKVLVEKDRFFAEEKPTRLLEPAGGVAFALVSAYTSLRLTSEPSGATVSVNGQDVGSTPTTTDVQKGTPLVLRFQRADLPTLDETLVLPKDAASETTIHRVLGSTPGSRRPVASLLQGHARYIPKGSFRRDGHTVTFTKGAWMLETEVTQAQYKAILAVLPEQLGFKDCGETCPVEGVSWDQAAFFANELSKKENLATCFKCTGSGEGVSCTADHANYTTCKGWRLPTEAEWEYAARAGTPGDTYGKLDDIAWYRGNSSSKTHPAGQKQANAWGLRDMIGNVWEWCYDWHSSYTADAQSDPAGPSSGSDRVYRGGGWDFDASSARASYRNGSTPSNRYDSLGFRLLRTE